jgi:hypothetical protein
MSLERIGDSDRNRLRVHGALLLIWSALVGSASSALLLHVFQVHSMAVRYSVGAAAVYFLGFLVGARFYAASWRQEDKRPLPAHASLEEQKEYQQIWHSQLVDPYLYLWKGEGGWVSSILSLITGTFIALFLLGVIYFFLLYLPMLGVEVFTGYVAEVVLEFVIGASIVQKIMKPRALDDYWPVMVKKTWITGCLLVAAAGGMGFLVQTLRPGAETIFQALL